YCHGYEIQNAKTGIFANGESGYDVVKLISNWTAGLTLFTNGASQLSEEQTIKLQEHKIGIIQKEITRLEHRNGYAERIHFTDRTSMPISAIYAPRPFEQHCKLPELIGCDLTDEGYLKIDASNETTVTGVFACGDNATRMRTLANAIAMGTVTGMMVSKKMILG
ncbi:MAG TPA: FAD-dependent oxidoreductase, partial [Flavobacterium sp.]